MTRQDIHEIEDTATAAEWGWIEAQESDVDVSALYAPPRPIRSDFGTGRGGNAAYRSALRDYNSLYGT